MDVHIEQMMDKLNAFESPEAIAGFFKQKGIRGDQNDGESCVITNWFLTETDAVGCSTTESTITIDDGHFNQYQMTPTDVVAEFITEFDNGAWPELVSQCGCDDCFSCFS